MVNSLRKIDFCTLLATIHGKKFRVPPPLEKILGARLPIFFGHEYLFESASISRGVRSEVGGQVFGKFLAGGKLAPPPPATPLIKYWGCNPAYLYVLFCTQRS